MHRVRTIASLVLSPRKRDFFSQHKVVIIPFQRDTIKMLFILSSIERIVNPLLLAPKKTKLKPLKNICKKTNKSFIARKAFGW
jgi:hypothetical protein